MPESSPQRSEVAELLAQIRCEYEAAEHGFSGLAQGSSQHQFLARRTERISELYSQLHNLLGQDAITLLAAQIDNASDGKQEIAQEKEGQVCHPRKNVI